MTRSRYLRLHIIFIYINLFNFLFGQTDFGSRLYHIPPNPPFVGKTVSFEATIPADIEVIEAFFYYKMNDQKSYNEANMEFLGNIWTATILSVPEGEKIEYFFIFRKQDGSEVSFQGNNPNENPYILSVIPNPRSENNIKDSKDIITSQE